MARRNRAWVTLLRRLLFTGVTVNHFESKASRAKDLTGQSFGRLKVVRFVGIGSRRHAEYLCRCKCGIEKVISARYLRSGQTVSCGCFGKTQHIKHGYHGTSTYRSWKGMIDRCYNRTNTDWHNYGGRGIRVCRRWRCKNGFAHFLEDMGPRPEGTTLDRRLTNGDYTPANCRWATKKEQNRNTRYNVRIRFRGRTQCLQEWAEELGIKYETLQTRRRAGWSVVKTFTTPVRQYNWKRGTHAT